MDIIDYLPIVKSFSELDEGQVFKYMTDYCMKTDEVSFNNSSIIVNYVRLYDGALAYLNENTKVEIVECSLKIKR